MKKLRLNWLKVSSNLTFFTKQPPYLGHNPSPTRRRLQNYCSGSRCLYRYPEKMRRGGSQCRYMSRIQNEFLFSSYFDKDFLWCFTIFTFKILTKMSITFQIGYCRFLIWNFWYFLNIESSAFLVMQHNGIKKGSELSEYAIHFQIRRVNFLSIDLKIHFAIIETT